MGLRLCPGAVFARLPACRASRRRGTLQLPPLWSAANLRASALSPPPPHRGPNDHQTPIPSSELTQPSHLAQQRNLIRLPEPNRALVHLLCMRPGMSPLKTPPAVGLPRGPGARAHRRSRPSRARRLLHAVPCPRPVPLPITERSAPTASTAPFGSWSLSADRVSEEVTARLSGPAVDRFGRS